MVSISAKTQDGIDELRNAIFKAVVSGESSWGEDACIPNMRHKDALGKALTSCSRLKDGLLYRATSDLLAIDLQDCLNQLSDIVGDTTTEDVLDVIFEQFCLGK